MEQSLLRQYGWDDAYSAILINKNPAFIPGRIIAQLTQVYKIITPHGEMLAEVSGKLQFQAQDKTQMPVIGDWVLCQGDASQKKCVIEEILPRKSSITRKKRDFGQDRSQVLAANIDFLGIVSALDETLNLNKIERFLTLAYENHINPLLIFNKTDLCPDLSSIKAELKTYFTELPQIFTCALKKEGLSQLSSLLSPGITLALVGSSGTGKSTLINDLYGENILQTAENREKDQKGRHTTTHKELILLPDRAMIIDTPGLREIALLASEESLQSVYAGIIHLASQCRFNDCSHTSEPGCAVQEAIDAGNLPPEKLKNFQKQTREIRAHQNEQIRRGNAKRRFKDVSKQLRKHKKNI